MLAALTQGVKACPRAGHGPDPRGGRWHSLIDKLYPLATLRAAFAAVKANRGAAGVDHVSIERYASDLDANLERLSESLRMGT
jgi:RNA-directed DNA polymerase